MGLAGSCCASLRLRFLLLSGILISDSRSKSTDSGGAAHPPTLTLPSFGAHTPDRAQARLSHTFPALFSRLPFLLLLLFSCFAHMQTLNFGNCCGQALDFLFVFFCLFFLSLSLSWRRRASPDSLLFEGETPNSTGSCWQWFYARCHGDRLRWAAACSWSRCCCWWSLTTT